LHTSLLSEPLDQTRAKDAAASWCEEPTSFLCFGCCHGHQPGRATNSSFPKTSTTSYKAFSKGSTKGSSETPGYTPEGIISTGVKVKPKIPSVASKAHGSSAAAAITTFQNPSTSILESKIEDVFNSDESLDREEVAGSELSSSSGKPAESQSIRPIRLTHLDEQNRIKAMSAEECTTGKTQCCQ